LEVFNLISNTPLEKKFKDERREANGGVDPIESDFE
jgi:hypothetical protein